MSLSSSRCGRSFRAAGSPTKRRRSFRLSKLCLAYRRDQPEPRRLASHPQCLRRQGHAEALSGCRLSQFAVEPLRSRNHCKVALTKVGES